VKFDLLTAMSVIVTVLVVCQVDTSVWEITAASFFRVNYVGSRFFRNFGTYQTTGRHIPEDGDLEALKCFLL
jgi:hypothetical protein